MTRMRFRIGTILVVIFFLGVGFAALREASELWQQIVFSVTVGTFLNSVLLAIYRTGGKRSFWVGFALFGWAYLALALVPSLESRLVTTRMLTYLDSAMFSRSDGWLALTVSVGPRGSNSASWTISRSGTQENFLKVGHALLALIAALVGGWISLRLARTHRPPAAE